MGKMAVRYRNRCRTRIGLETGVAYLSGEFRGKDGWLKEPVEVGISSRFINNIRFRRRVPDMIRQMCNLCLYRAQSTRCLFSLPYALMKCLSHAKFNNATTPCAPSES
jgi:hypothetical protein